MLSVAFFLASLTVAFLVLPRLSVWMASATEKPRNAAIKSSTLSGAKPASSARRTVCSTSRRPRRAPRRLAGLLQGETRSGSLSR